MEKLMTVDEVAQYLRLNREVVLRKVRKGEIPAVKVGTRTYRFYREQIDEWLMSRTPMKPEAQVYPSRSKGYLNKKDFRPVIKETGTEVEVIGETATLDKERQLAIIAEARKLQAKMEKRLGKPLPSSAGEIRALREERARRAS
jgi:excisionase family DNA binding protein